MCPKLFILPGKTVKMYLKIVFNEHVFLNTLGFRKRKRNVTRICSTSGGKNFFFKELSCSKNSLLTVFCDFVILIGLDVHMLPVCFRSVLHVSINRVFDKMETVLRVYTGVCIHVLLCLMTRRKSLSTCYYL